MLVPLCNHQAATQLPPLDLLEALRSDTSRLVFARPALGLQSYLVFANVPPAMQREDALTPVFEMLVER